MFLVKDIKLLLFVLYKVKKKWIEEIVYKIVGYNFNLILIYRDKIKFIFYGIEK